MTETPQQQPSPEPTAINADESPSPSRGDSSPASAKASPGSPFIADPGGAFDPASAPPAPELPPTAAEAEQLLLVEWDEESIARWLLVQGELTHSLVGIADADWKHTAADLKSMAGPLARILNRYDTTRAIAAYNDPASVIFGMSMYTIRSMGERRRVLAALRAQAAEEDDAGGHPGPPPGMPDPNPDEVDWTIS